MARPLRIEYPGAVYHVTARGNGRQRIYLGDDDRELFLKTLDSVVKRYRWLCHGYCLMDNHYHLLIETPEGNLARGMRQLNGTYTQRFNARHRRIGHVLQGRYKAILVDKDAYLLELCRYIVLNPVRAGRVRDAGEWRWSSYRATAGQTKAPECVSTDWILGMFSDKERQARKHYRKFVTEGQDKESPWNELKGQILLGGEAFVDKFRDLLSDKETLEEIPKYQRYVERPELKRILSGYKNAGRPEQLKMVHQAHVGYGYTPKKIAERLGVHYTTVSKMVTSLAGQ